MQSTNRKYNGAAAAAVLTIVILGIRAPHRLIDGYLWAEDAPQFLGTAYSIGITSIYQPYAGYLHVIPRLISIIQWWIFPVRAAPHFFVISSVVAAAASSAYIYHATSRFEWVRDRRLMASLMAIAPWLAPQSGEVFLNITNLQWVLAPAFMVFIWETVAIDRDHDVSMWTVALRMVCMLLLSTTGPLGVFAMPLAVACSIYRAQKHGITEGAGDPPAFLAYIAGSAMQVMVYANNRQVIPGNNLSWIHELAAHLFASLLVQPAAVDSHPIGGALAATAVVMAIATGLSIRRARLPVLMLLCVACAAWAGGMLKTPEGAPHMIWNGPASRYTYLTGVFILWSVILIWGSAPKRFGVAFSGVLGILIVLNGMSLFRFPDMQDWTIIRKSDVYEIHSAPGWVTKLTDSRNSG